MQRRRTMLAEGFEMIGCGVTLVAGESVEWIDGVPFFHAGVAMGFCEDRSGGDGNAAGVALDEGFLLDYDVELHGVDEQIVWLNGELQKSGGHGLAAGLVDVPGVDALGVDLGHGPGESVLTDADGKFAAALRGEFFRIVEADNAALGIENDGGGDYGAKQRTAAGFIETGNASPAELPRRALEAGRAETRHRWQSLAQRR